VRAILLVDHGSRRAEANEVVTVARAQLEALGAAPLVGHAHLEIAPPSIAEGVEALIARGATELFVQPWFLAPGRHAEHDVPEAVRQALGDRPIPVAFGAPFGAAEELVALVRRRAPW
jgi:sirohydrochlorin ferrochelatase